MRPFKQFLVVTAFGILAAQVIATKSEAATYYVDYSGQASDDSRDGLTPATSWKHCPGDQQIFSGNALFTKTLEPGDTVIFKGGVEYRAHPIRLKSSGTPGVPITYDGNTAGTYGTGPAIFTGALQVSGWVQCTSQADAFGAPDWANCYRLDNPDANDPNAFKAQWALDPLAVNLFYDTNIRGVVARSPNASDAFAWDAVPDLQPLTTAQITTTTITIPNTFLPTPVLGQSWAGAWVTSRNSANRMSFRPVNDALSDGVTIRFDVAVTPIGGNLNSFAIWNHARLLDQRGEYILTNSNKTIIFYAGPGGAAPTDTRINRYFATPLPTAAGKPYDFGVHLNGKDHIIIQGIDFQYYTGAAGATRGGAGVINYVASGVSSFVTIRNCTFQNNASLTGRVAPIQIAEADNTIIDSCYVAWNQGSRGISVFGNNAAVTNNLVTRNGNTGIFTSGGNNQTISGNDVTFNNGLHGNGISIYGPTDGATVERNYVLDSNFGITLQGCKNVNISYNIVKTRGPSMTALAIYGPRSTDYDASNIVLRNNTILSENYIGLRLDDQRDGAIISGLVVENNILDSYNFQAAQPTAYNKNYFLKTVYAVPPANNFPPDGKDPFVSRATNDLHLVASSTAVDNGLTWTFGNGDFEENPIIGQRDIGAYEFQRKGVVLEGGRGFSIALKTDGTIWTWGNNSQGQLGKGGTVGGNFPTPTLVSGVGSVQSVAAGHAHTLLLKTDGTVWASGDGAFGQLGSNSTSDSTSFNQVAGLVNITAIAAGDYHSLAVKDDGTLWAWGRNNFKQVSPVTGDKLIPTQVSITDVKLVAGGGSGSGGHTLALKNDGTVWAWGQGTLGQLGNGASISSSTPVPVSGLTSIASVAAGGSHSAAVSSTGAAYTWGANSSGQLGDGFTSNRNTPYLTSVSAVRKAICGNTFTKVLTTTGNVWAWGANSNGQFGNGTTTSATGPVQIGGLIGIADIGKGQLHTMHRRADGTVVDSGYNLEGQIGDGTVGGNRISPTVATNVDLD